ncbi:MAG: glycoside hydrolase family 13 protein [Propionicimonas sp.]|uniref:glycoside hydrolase family 13 protein n=1 Tax=Propionicimonas sp. TaxID=1955623 RepID=UPI003D0B9F51
MTSPWWRDAVVYQIYPRSFADANNDGTGDVQGMISKLDHLASLGVNAVWVSPWYPSPMADGGYDVSDYCDIDPRFGTLADADEFLAGAHARGIRVLIDLVPNHCSVAHPAFRAALAAGPGSPERALFHFRDGLGPDGDQPPTNWGSLFGGPAWERVVGPDGPEQWYLHMFASEQPDWNWANPAVAEMFDDVIRFWFDRGVDGLRVDVADSLAKDMSFPDTPVDPVTGFGRPGFFPGHPWWNQPELEAIQRHWREIADSYSGQGLGERIFVCEANVKPLDALIRFVDPGRMHTTFNFDMLWCEWGAGSLRAMIDRNLIAHASVGAPTTWVLGNHDSTRVVTRYGKPETGRPFTLAGADPEWLDRLAEYFYPMPTDVELGRRRARAAALLEFALPGPAYIYQGEELGLPEVEDLPADVLDDPSYFRTGGRVRGRDGCRVPLPWSGTAAPYGFGVDATPWLPQPAAWADLSAAAQDGDPASTLALYRRALSVRANHPALGDGTLAWSDEYPGSVLAFTRDPGFGCVVNLSPDPVDLPAGAEVLVASADLVDGRLPTDTAVWLALP